jgi:transcriptional regulator with XRE-family HTH domain
MSESKDAEVKTSPTAAQQFGEEVALWRDHAGITQQDLAEKVGYARSYVAMVETGERLGSEKFAQLCDEVFDTPKSLTRLRARLVRAVLPPWFEPYVELEKTATIIRSFQSQVMPGYLQTEDYARAMLAAVRPENLEDLVSGRMERRRVLEREDRPYVWLILDELALYRVMGGPAVMAAQLTELLEAASHPRTVVQIVPKDVAAHAGLAGPFTLLNLANGEQVLWVDGHSQGRMGYDRAETAAAVQSYDLLRAVAQSPEVSAETIRTYLERLK